MKILLPDVNHALYPMAQNVVNGPAIQAWVQGVAQEQALNKNSVAATEYTNTTFGNWLMNYDAGRLDGGNPNTPPPMPPNGFTVHVADDNVTCELVQDGPPVCGLPPYTKIPAPQTLAEAQNMLNVLGGNMGQSVAVSPFNKSVPVYGGAVTAPDGSAWIRVS